MKRLHFRDIKQVINLISSCLQVLSKGSPRPGKEFQEWPNCPYMRTLLAIEERPAFLCIMRYISSRIGTETFSSKSPNWPYLVKTLGMFIQRVSSCPKVLEKEPDTEGASPEEFNFKRLVSCELNELVKLLNIIELNLEFAAPEVASDLLLYIQPAYQEIQSIPASALIDQGDVLEKGSVIPLIQSIDSLMESLFKRAEFPDDPGVLNEVKIAQIMVWILSNRKGFGEFHDAVDKIVKSIFQDGIVEGIKLICRAAKIELEDTDEAPHAFADRNLELYKLLVALILKNMSEHMNNSTKFSVVEIEEINQHILALFQLGQTLFVSFESAHMATFDLLISSMHKRYPKIFDTKAGFSLDSRHRILELKMVTPISNLHHIYSRRRRNRKNELSQ